MIADELQRSVHTTFTDRATGYHRRQGTASPGNKTAAFCETTMWFIGTSGGELLSLVCFVGCVKEGMILPFIRERMDDNHDEKPTN